MPGYFDSKYNNNTCHDKFLEFIHFYYKTDTRQKMNTHNARSCDSTRSLIVAKYLEISFLCKVQEKKHDKVHKKCSQNINGGDLQKPQWQKKERTKRP